MQDLLNYWRERVKTGEGISDKVIMPAIDDPRLFAPQYTG
jgi:hypothetical protein